MAKKGPKSRGLRRQFTLMFPQADFDLYADRAREQGIAVGDYIAAACARAHGRPEPEYVRTKRVQDQPDLISA